ncbi:MAG: hypothetical protein DRQ40_09150 [Gammaproteobacteria bacterium]|nr:MAG: hypothetical protein DRQ40_09150 [Gammaproteobacteria bacterium]
MLGKKKIRRLEARVQELERSCERLESLYFQKSHDNTDLEKQKDILLEQLYEMTAERDEAQQHSDKWYERLIEANKAIDARDAYWGPLCKEITALLQPGLMDYYCENNGPSPWEEGVRLPDREMAYKVIMARSKQLEGEA